MTPSQQAADGRVDATRIKKLLVLPARAQRDVARASNLTNLAVRTNGRANAFRDEIIELLISAESAVDDSLSELTRSRSLDLTNSKVAATLFSHKDDITYGGRLGYFKLAGDIAVRELDRASRGTPGDATTLCNALDKIDELLEKFLDIVCAIIADRIAR